MDAVQNALQIIVKLDGQETTDLVPLSDVTSLGAGHGDRLTCAWLRDGLLAGTKAAEHPQGELIVEAVDPRGQKQVLFVGWGSGVGHDLDDAEPTVEFRIARRHYGRPLLGVRQMLAPQQKRHEIATTPQEQRRNETSSGGSSGLKRILPKSWTEAMAGQSGQYQRDVAKIVAGRSQFDARSGSGPRPTLAGKSDPGTIRKPTEVVDDDQQVTLVIRDVVFNPLIDGIVRGNMHEIEGRFLGFIDHESTRTESARKYLKYEFATDKQFAESEDKRIWTLPKAVRYLCETLNPDETHIKNPPQSELDEIEQAGTAPQLRNLQIKTGLHLNECLEVLLKPLGYTHFLTINRSGRPQIALRRRGVGPKKQVRLQPLKDDFDAGKNDLDRKGNISAGSQTSFNSMMLVGSNKRYEITRNLVQGWKKAHDSLTEEETSTESERYRDEPELRDVFRKFAANEAGDYNDTRPGIKAWDLKAIFGHDAVPRRRKVWPCLTRMPDGTPIGDDGVIIEWQRTDESADDWHTLDELEGGGYELLEQEIGFRFTGQQPPPEVVAGEIRFRITCSIDDDERVVSEFVDGASALAGQIWHVADEPTRFHWRRVHASSQHFQKVKNGTFQADEVDDSEAMRLHAAALVASFNMLDVGAHFRVIGLFDPMLEPGDVIDAITGRNIQLTAMAGGGQERFPQITSVSRDYQSQSRIVTLQTLRDEVVLPSMTNRRPGRRRRGQ